MKIREELKSNGGYITADNMESFMEEFGSDFPVVVKRYEGHRLCVAADEVKDLDQSNIREVFINAEEYDNL